MQSYNRYIGKIVEDEDGELCLDFPDDLIENLGWKIGDVLVWEPGPDATWIIKRFVEEKDDE